MDATRRRLIAAMPAGLALAMLPSLRLLAATPKAKPAALLVPLGGPQAALGLSMQRAAAMVQAASGTGAELIPYDTGGTPAGAAAAAALAIRRGAGLLLGPLASAEVRPVVAAAAGRVPVIAFSNDEALRESGAFLLGITATQSVGSILGYARRRGIRRVAMLASATPWGLQATPAAQRIAGDLGLDLAVVPVAAPAALASRDALLVVDGGTAFTAAGAVPAGVQLLGTHQALDAAPAPEGAWIAAPDPAGFDTFARDYEARNGGRPGLVTALAFDGAGIVKALRSGGRTDRAALLATQSFPGVTGALRFREDGSAARALSILVGGQEGWTAAETPAS